MTILPLLAEVTLFELLKQGGWAMYPLGALSLTLFALILLVWLQTSRGFFGLRPSRFNDSPITSQIEDRIGAIRGKSLDSGRRAQLDDFLAGIESGTLRWIQYLNVIATIAPMVGLLGTVSGMIGAFQTIATGGMGKPELLAGDIGEALITTATGLTIGIPAMIGYFMLRNRLDSRLEEVEEWILDPPDKTAGDA
jgi:biopolymer transport protein ExbB